MNTGYLLQLQCITFKPDQNTASFEVSIPDDEDVQETRKLRLSFDLQLITAQHTETVSETVITIEDNELEISLRPRLIVVTEGSTSFVTLQLEASRLTSIDVDGEPALHG